MNNCHKGLSDSLGFITRLINDPSALVASSALRITVNRGLGSFYGEKYNIDKVHDFEDDKYGWQLIHFGRHSKTQGSWRLEALPLCMMQKEGDSSCMVCNSLNFRQHLLYVLSISLVCRPYVTTFNCLQAVRGKVLICHDAFETLMRRFSAECPRILIGESEADE